MHEGMCVCVIASVVQASYWSRKTGKSCNGAKKNFFRVEKFMDFLFCIESPGNVMKVWEFTGPCCFEIKVNYKVSFQKLISQSQECEDLAYCSFMSHERNFIHEGNLSVEDILLMEQ